MKFKFALASLLYLFCLAVFSQDKFRLGYIIDNNREKIHCQIRNIGKEESTLDYQYRLNSDGEIRNIELSRIAEFGIDDELRCIRALVSIETSSNRITNLNDTILSWEEGHAYLKVLVEGEAATLYSNNDHGRPLFFFSVGNSGIELLLQKTYYFEVTSTINRPVLHNNTFREQLNRYMLCGEQNADKISYTKKDLVKFFSDYYKCKGIGHRELKSSHSKVGKLLLRPVFSLNKIQFGIQDPVDSAPKVTFGSENSLGFGIGIEYILPYNRYTWSLFAETNYYSYGTNIISSPDVTGRKYDHYEIEYKSLEFPVGLTYYFNIADDNSIFVKAGYVPHIILQGSNIRFQESHAEEFASSSRLLFGAGYNYRGIGLEFRYYIPLNITSNLYKRASNLNQISIRVSYSFKILGETIH